VEAEAAEFSRLNGFLADAKGPLAVALREDSNAGTVGGFRIPISPLSVSERRQLWRESFGDSDGELNCALDRIAEYFDLDAASIRLVAHAANEAAAKDPDCGLAKLAWSECRIQARRSFEGLARRIPARAAWSDLILPDLQKDTLRQIVAHVRQRSVVN